MSVTPYSKPYCFFLEFLVTEIYSCSAALSQAQMKVHSQLIRHTSQMTNLVPTGGQTKKKLF